MHTVGLEPMNSSSTLFLQGHKWGYKIYILVSIKKSVLLDWQKVKWHLQIMDERSTSADSKNQDTGRHVLVEFYGSRDK